jgi:hypothetical protein
VHHFEGKTLDETITGPKGAKPSNLIIRTSSLCMGRYPFEKPHCGTPPANLGSLCHFLHRSDCEKDIIP